MDLIDQFLERYTKEYDYYSHTASIVQQKLEANLQAAGVRSIVTARAKSITSLETKCRKRGAAQGEYMSIDEIYEDIVDLAGVRVALYFPAEIAQVDGAITRLFDVIEKKEFPDKEKVRPGKPRFSGYSATHYRVQLKNEDLSETDKRYAVARIEIQVATVLMHAWSEVEHDLVYKPQADELSEEEYALLDQVNGLVMSGEIALGRLQKAGEARVAVSNRKITNHYDLAALLLSAGEGLTEGPISDSGLGRVDQLFDLVHELGIDTPASLKRYIDVLHGNVELRPLAEQIIDALLAEDPSRYDIYDVIRTQRFRISSKTDSNEELYRHIGRFLSIWRELEALVNQASEAAGRGPVLPNGRQLLTLELLSPGKILDFDQLRRLRNSLVHSAELPELAELDAATNRLESILAEVRRQFEKRQDGSQPSQLFDIIATLEAMLLEQMTWCFRIRIGLRLNLKIQCEDHEWIIQQLDPCGRVGRLALQNPSAVEGQDRQGLRLILDTIRAAATSAFDGFTGPQS